MEAIKNLKEHKKPSIDELIRDAEIKALEQNKNKGLGQGNNGSDDQSSTEMSIGKTKEEREGR